MAETDKADSDLMTAGTQPSSTEAPPVVRKAEPFEVAVLALQNTTLFPETVVPLAIGRPRSVAAVEAALATEEKLLACITVRADIKTSTQDAKPSDLYEIGTLAMIKRMERIEDTMHIIAQGTERIKVIEWKQEEPYLRALVQMLPEESGYTEEVEAMKRQRSGRVTGHLRSCRSVPLKFEWQSWLGGNHSASPIFLGSILISASNGTKMLRS